MKKLYVITTGIILIITGCNRTADVEKQLKYTQSKVMLSLSKSVSYEQMPRSVDKNGIEWNYVSYKDWTSGFWPGILWYTYEISGNEYIREKAERFTEPISGLAFQSAHDHDLGFMVYCSYGNAYRLTGNPEYKKIILNVADSLATLFNPVVGTMCSWPGMIEKMNWPHNTIIDNMMNLEILFWASKNGGEKKLYDIALSHAEKTMKNHFREDFSAYHVVVYDTITGKKIEGITHQGFSDNSMWARGQAWAVYGFTMCYRETERMEFLDFVQKIADLYISELPEDFVPFWDFDATGIPDEPKDASASAIAASALLELSELLKPVNPEKANIYKEVAIKITGALSGDGYRSDSKNPSFLMHSTGHKPARSEIDVSIIYADYYYLEALLRLYKILKGNSIYENL